jgi:hypothetical protein
MTRQEKYQKQKAICLKRFEGSDEPNKTLVLFLHHGRFCELLTEPIENRINFIIEHKDETEIKTRLKWIQPVNPDTLSLECQKVLTKYYKARAECGEVWTKYLAEVWDQYNKSWVEYNEARDQCGKAWAKFYKTLDQSDKGLAEYYKALAEYNKAWAKRAKARAECNNARAKYNKTRAECDNARAECGEMGAKFTKLYEPVFMAEHPDCPWNGYTLFPAQW